MHSSLSIRLLILIIVCAAVVSCASRWRSPRIYGGSGRDSGYDISIGPDGTIWVAGWHDAGRNTQESRLVQSTDPDVVSTCSLIPFNLAGPTHTGKSWWYHDPLPAGIYVEATATGDIFMAGVSHGPASTQPRPRVYTAEAWMIKNPSLTSGNRDWVGSWGGTNEDAVTAMASDGESHILVTGYFGRSPDFDPGKAVAQRQAIGRQDVFVSKFDTTPQIMWTQTFGGEQTTCEGRGIAADSEGSVYVVGSFDRSLDLDALYGDTKLEANGETDIFLVKFDSASSFRWARSVGGPESDTALGVTVDDSGRVCIVGAFGGSVDFDPGPGADIHVSNGAHDVCLSVYDQSGGHLWTTTWGGALDDEAHGVCVDRQGNIFVTGGFSDVVDFGHTAQTSQFRSHGGLDFFVSKFSAEGEREWAFADGTSRYDDLGRAIIADERGYVHVTGQINNDAFMFSFIADRGERL